MVTHLRFMDTQTLRTSMRFVMQGFLALCIATTIATPSIAAEGEVETLKSYPITRYAYFTPYGNWNETVVSAQIVPSSNSGCTSNCTLSGTTSFTGQIELTDGTAAAPALRFSADTDTGFGRINGTPCLIVNGGCKLAAWSPWVNLVSGGTLGWSSNATDPSAAGPDTQLSRVSADVPSLLMAKLPNRVEATANFSTSGSGTALEAITGLTWTVPANTASNYHFDCYLVYSQATAAVAVAFGVQNATVASTDGMLWGMISTNTTVANYANVVAFTATTATAVVSATPSAITTKWNAELHGFIEQPSNASASAFTIRVSTATAGDIVTVYRGSYCTIF